MIYFITKILLLVNKQIFNNIGPKGIVQEFTLKNSINNDNLYNLCNQKTNDLLPNKIKLQLQNNNIIEFIETNKIFTDNIISKLDIIHPFIFNSNKKDLQGTLSFNCNKELMSIDGLLINNNNIVEFSNNPNQKLIKEYIVNIKNSNISPDQLLVMYDISSVFIEEAKLLSVNDFLIPDNKQLNIDIINGKNDNKRYLRVNKWNNCFRNDNIKHVLNIGIAVGSSLFRNKYNNNKQTAINSIANIINKANLIYGVQLNIILKVTSLYISSIDGNPSWDSYNRCVRKQVNINNQLSLFKSWVRQNNLVDGLWHLLDDCFAGSGVVGLAWVGTLCQTQSGYNTGISWWSRRHWITVAHEIGHNFGAQHSFENGRGTTGGIMDYGNGLFNGEYQFNTRYRKYEVCKTINNIIGKCKQLSIIDNINKPTPTLSPTNSRICKVYGGGVSSGTCIFPFVFRGITYNKCTTVTDPDDRAWCSTMTNYNNIHIQGNWGYCKRGCPGY